MNLTSRPINNRFFQLRRLRPCRSNFFTSAPSPSRAAPARATNVILCCFVSSVVVIPSPRRLHRPPPPDAGPEVDGGGRPARDQLGHPAVCPLFVRLTLRTVTRSSYPSSSSKTSHHGYVADNTCSLTNRALGGRIHSSRAATLAPNHSSQIIRKKTRQELEPWCACAVRAPPLESSTSNFVLEPLGTRLCRSSATDPIPVTNPSLALGPADLAPIVIVRIQIAKRNSSSQPPAAATTSLTAESSPPPDADADADPDADADADADPDRLLPLPSTLSSPAAVDMSSSLPLGPQPAPLSDSVPALPQASSSARPASASTPVQNSSSSLPPHSSSSSLPPPSTSSLPPPVTTSSSIPAPPTTTASTSSASTPAPPSSSSTNPQAASSSSSPVVVVTHSNTAVSTQVIVATSTSFKSPSPASTSSTTSSTPTPIDPSGAGDGGMGQGSKVAIGVVVPIAAIAILAIVGLLWWKKRRARQEAEEERRKEVEEYAYNPNADPTIPSVGLGPDAPYEMREDGPSGYRGWGSTTAAGSTGRKPSTTMTGGMTAAYSDAAFSVATSPGRRNGSETRSGEHLLDGSSSPDGEILGAAGPSATTSRGTDVRRGPSNASSSYSVAARSEAGSESGVYGNGGTHYDQYGQNPYSEPRPQEAPAQAVIRDNPARRNTRIEGPAHFPQQSSGIAQNF
ncbi:hypothetical protein DCS_02885 [Drechmeria coniospora]|uniref:Uncharacterized protein n=1 Tax=Drechmeria coniospora TaxID=98403 RepID=A0A151GXI0_DRECN|nr:hypothetical protein DCS_02885 [Drechmeria coniospora]KYK61742.1 hypothetical protein DCS_02885 [Drechmeria coniospora]